MNELQIDVYSIPSLEIETSFSFWESQSTYFETEEKTKNLEKSTINQKKFPTTLLSRNPKNIKTISSNKSNMVIGNIGYDKTRNISPDYSMVEIQQKAKEKYGIILSDDPTEEEMGKVFESWLDGMINRAKSINSNLENTLKEIEELKSK